MIYKNTLNRVEDKFIQDNNAAEAYSSKIMKKRWLESCGNVSATIIAAVFDRFVDEDEYFNCPGGWQMPADDFAWIYMNLPANYEKFLKTRPNLNPNEYPGNRVPQYYEDLFRDVFDIEAHYGFRPLKSKLIQHIKEKNAFMMLFKKPRHYVCVVEYDVSTDEWIYIDPWKKNKMNKNNGWRERIKADSKNIQPHYVLAYR